MQLFEEQERQETRNHTPIAPPEPSVQMEARSPDPEPETPPERGFLPVLKNSRFLVLWLGQVFSQLSDKVYLVLTIAILTTQFEIGDRQLGAWVSAITIAFSIPAVLFGSLAGVYVDRWFKKEILVSTNLLRGIFVLTIPPLLWMSGDWGSFWGIPWRFGVLLGITFLVSTLTQFFAPAEQAAIPLIVKGRNLLPANSLYTTTMIILLIVGFALGEPLLALTDRWVSSFSNWTFGKELLVGGCYAIAGLILLFLKTGESKESFQGDRPHVFQDIWDGILYLGKNHRVRNAMIQLTILCCIFAALMVVAVPLAASIPGLKAQQFGFLLASGGVGIVLSAFCVGHWGQHLPRIKLSFWGSLGSGVSLLGLSASTHHLIAALLATAFFGSFAALVFVPMQTTIQAETPEEMRGKVFGLQNNAVNIALSLPLALAGVAESIWGLLPVLWSLAAFAIAGGLLTWYFSRPSVVTSSQVQKS